MGRVYNFSAGPSMMPLEVLEKAASEMTNYNNSGQSVMEMSHRSKVYEEIIFGAGALLREILNVPENYKILFLQGGASTQFSNIPMNLLQPGDKAAYAVTGQFAKKAYKEATKLFENISVAASSEDRNFCYIPSQDSIKLDGDEKYFHYCANNTIFGTEWKYIPDTKGIPIVSDMSSNILSKPIDVSKYGIIYAGAQKNMGSAGLAVVIVKDDLRGKCPNIPTMSDYSVMAENDSMYNTPPTYAIYILKLVLEWIKGLGGLIEMQKININKAAVLYNYLDSSNMFIATADKDCRSLMNVTFKTNSEELDAKFVKEATANGFVNLKGHRSVGGMRASIYNAMPKEGIEKLVTFMEQFEKENANV